MISKLITTAFCCFTMLFLSVLEIAWAEQCLGIITNGKLVTVFPQQGFTYKPTTVAIMEARSPESGQLQLEDYEGLAVMIDGKADSYWLYSAKIVDKAGPLVTVLVKQLSETIFSPLNHRSKAMDNTIEKLTKDLSSEDYSIRMDAARRLGDMGTPASSAIPMLMEMMKNDPDQYARHFAEEAVKKIKNVSS